MDNLILDKILEQVDTGLHILAITVRQISEVTFEAVITYQDWSSDENWMAEDKGYMEITEFSRLPDTTLEIEATVEMIEDWMIEVARVGNALDVAKFEADGYRKWLTKPIKWRKTENSNG